MAAVATCPASTGGATLAGRDGEHPNAVATAKSESPSALDVRGNRLRGNVFSGSGTITRLAGNGCCRGEDNQGMVCIGTAPECAFPTALGFPRRSSPLYLGDHA